MDAEVREVIIYVAILIISICWLCPDSRGPGKEEEEEEEEDDFMLGLLLLDTTQFLA